MVDHNHLLRHLGGVDVRVAAIDCGTNSIRLLVADIHGSVLTEVKRRMTIVRLGEGVDRTGVFSEAALTRTFTACDDYARVIDALDVDRVRFVATSASRDAANRDDLMSGIRTRLGVDPEVITGGEEALLSFRGAVEGLPPDLVSPPAVVVDIGGGSTEFVLGDRSSGGELQMQSAVSVDIGCVRMTERHLHGDPPDAEQIALVEADVAAALDRSDLAVPWRDADTLIGVAGTVTTIVALARGLSTYDPALIHGMSADLDEVEAITERLLTMDRHARAALPVMHPGRVDVIIGGALVLRAILRRAGRAVTASETDILDGVARSLAER